MIHDGLVRYHDDLKNLMVDINDLQPHPANPNNGDLDAVAESIQVNGMYRPIYAQTSTRTILAGHTTWGACHELGATHVPVLWLDIDDKTALKIVLADNKTAHLATLDPALEAAALLSLDDDLDGTGYTPTTSNSSPASPKPRSPTPTSKTPGPPSASKSHPTSATPTCPSPQPQAPTGNGSR